jgi:hypothetical protein
MSRSPPLTKAEKDMTHLMHFKGKKATLIAESLGRPYCMIRYCIAEINGAVRKPRLGNRPLLSDITKRAICRRASNVETTSNQIIGEYTLKVSKRTVQRVIKKCPYIHREKMLRGQGLGAIHMRNRLASSQRRKKWRNEWLRIIFSDEKKFSLDGPDNHCYYYHDIGKPKRFRCHRQAGGGSVMVWGSFGCFGKTPLVFIMGNQKADDYQNTLDEHLAPVFDDLAVHPSIFQHDGAAIHTAHSTMDWFRDRHVLRLGWPSRSPDLNPMENLWAILEQKIYENGKIYYHVADLKRAVTAAWDAIPVPLLRKLVESMPHRMAAVIKAKGGQTKY